MESEHSQRVAVATASRRAQPKSPLGGLRLGRAFGVEISLDFTLIIVFILLGMRPWWERRRVVDTGDGRLAMDTVGSVVIQIKR